MIGNTIHSIKSRVRADLVRRYVGIPVANVSDCMSRMMAGGARLRPMHSGGYLAGPAFTVKTRPGDNLLVHRALDLAQAGDVLVIDAGGDLTNAVIGEIMLTYAQKRGIAGVIVNGAIRDASAIRAGQYPVFAAGVTHRGPYKSGPGEIGGEVAVDGMVIAPGDLMIGDDDGVLCVPKDMASELFDAASAKKSAEDRILSQLRADEPIDRSWVTSALQAAGVVDEN